MKQASASCPVVFTDGTKCTRPVRLNGFCSPCATWSKRHCGADPNGRRAYPKRSRDEVLAAALAIPQNAKGCRINDGTFSTDVDGYPTVKLQGKCLRVTRIVLEHTLGRTLSPGMFACHRCDIPACMNPGCLWEGAPVANTHDALMKGRWATEAAASSSKPDRKLGDDDVRRIRALVAGGTSREAVARMYRVHRSTISRIVSRQKRAWIP